MKILKFLALTLFALLGITAVLLYEGDIPKDVIDARYANPGSQFADLDDLGRIHYRDEGHRRFLPLVLLHGSNASLHTFEPWVAKLEDTCRIITIDLPGHGLTGEIPAEDYSAATMVVVVDEITSRLGLDEFIIGGNSMGGGIALRYTLENPEKVSGLVLINSSGPVRARVMADDSQGVLAFRLLGYAWFRQAATLMDPYYLIEQGLRAAFHNKDLVTPGMVMRYNDLTLRAGTRRAIMQRFAQRSDYKYQAEDLRKIKAPTLIMWGKEDGVIPFAFASEYEKLIPGIKTAYYDDVGHIPMEENPERSANDLMAFLEPIRSTFDHEG